jgi:kinesin family protein C1
MSSSAFGFYQDPVQNPKVRDRQRQVVFQENQREASLELKMSSLRLASSSTTTSRQSGLTNGSSDQIQDSKRTSLTSITESDESSETGATSAVILFNGQEKPPKTPSKIPVLAAKPEQELVAPAPALSTPSLASKRGSSPLKTAITPFLTKDSKITNPFFEEFDVQGRLQTMDAQWQVIAATMSDTTAHKKLYEDTIEMYKQRVAEIDKEKTKLEQGRETLEQRAQDMHAQLLAQQAETAEVRQKMLQIQSQAEDDRRAQRNDHDDTIREHRREIDQIRRDMLEEIERLKKIQARDMDDELERAERRRQTQIENMEREFRLKLEDEERRRIKEVEEIRSQIAVEQENLDQAVGNKDREISDLRRQLEELRVSLDAEKIMRSTAQKSLAEASAVNVSQDSTIRSLKDRIQFLESGSQEQSDRFALMEQQLHDAVEAKEVAVSKLIKEETLRRILFNQVQELKGNIRVMCRVRPPMREEAVATINYPDLDKESKELELQGPEEKSSLGTITRKKNAFSFDRVFGPSTQNEEVFGEISQLVQSALDGYNVCIFCYGQTGAGKTHTMSSADGMIPRATKMIYDQATALQEKGWTYHMEGSFVEVYNEEIHDLLGSPREFDKVKHEIKHDDKRKTTAVTNLKTVELDSPDAVEQILKRADQNRSVAATKSNERSSRSHSVFVLKLVGRNSTTGETSEGTLNLVDLAGSERLKQSGAEGERMKETQNINKSLSCLGDVIGALGQGKDGAHIPYRNSKLTYLLQYSLGGNSKTLMFVMISPLEAHLKETLTSLKFATKVCFLRSGGWFWRNANKAAGA